MGERFTILNTRGYSEGDLFALNEAYADIMANSAADMSEVEDHVADTWRAHVAEHLLARYDAGYRGKALRQ